MERFPLLLDLFHISIRERTRRKCLPKGRPIQRKFGRCADELSPYRIQSRPINQPARPLTGARGSIRRPSLPHGELRRTSAVNKTLAEAIWEVNPQHLFHREASSSVLCSSFNTKMPPSSDRTATTDALSIVLWGSLQIYRHEWSLLESDLVTAPLTNVGNLWICPEYWSNCLLWQLLKVSLPESVW